MNVDDLFASATPADPAPPAVPAFIQAIRPAPKDVLSPGFRAPPRRFLLSREPTPAEVQDARDPSWIGVIPAGKVGILAGAGGEGKSRAALQLAIAVCTGRRFLARTDARGEEIGGWMPTTIGRVLLMCGEEDEAELHARLAETAAVLGLDEADRERLAQRLHLAPLSGIPGTQLTDDRGGTTTEALALREHLARLAADGADGGAGFALVILDPLSRFAGGGVEVDNALATRFITAAEGLTQGAGNPAVLVIHHTSQGARQSGSGDATAARGVTGLTDGARFMLSLSAVRGFERGGAGEPIRLPSGPALRLRVAKVNNAAQAPDLVLIRGRHGVLREAGPDEAARIEALQARPTKSPRAEKASPEGRGSRTRTPKPPPASSPAQHQDLYDDPV